MTKIKYHHSLIFILLIVIVSISFFETSNAYAEGTFVYVSNGDDGDISIMKLNEETGDLTMLDKVPAGPKVMHMATSPDHKFAFASIRSEPYSVISYSINSESGYLTQISRTRLPDNMVYISVDKSGRFLLSASNGGGKIAINPIDFNGTVQSKPIQIVLSGPNPHSIRTDWGNKFAYVPQLGNDRIKQYLFNNVTGMLSPNDPPEILTNVGSGPRHFDISPDNKFLYLSNEKDGAVYSFIIDNHTGVLSEIQRLPVIPLSKETNGSSHGNGTDKSKSNQGEDQNAGVADIHVTPNGKWLYVSERATNSISAFSIDKNNGNLTFIQNYETEKNPRGINIDPTGNYLLSAGEESGSVSAYAINQQNGKLDFKKRIESGKDPNWIEIVNFR